MKKEKKQYKWVVTEGVYKNKNWKRYKRIEKRSRQR
jgi:hypothetical protein